MNFWMRLVEAYIRAAVEVLKGRRAEKERGGRRPCRRHRADGRVRVGAPQDRVVESGEPGVDLRSGACVGRHLTATT